MKNTNFFRYALTSCMAAVLFAGCRGSQPPIGATGVVSDSGDSLPYHKTFHYKSAEQFFVVPKGVTMITVVARGASGGPFGSGRGGRVYAMLPVVPKERLAIFVGGRGRKFAGGFNGGGEGGWVRGTYNYAWGGGGASDVRERGGRLSNRILVAGGGGGQGDRNAQRHGFGGDGGGLVGEDGAHGRRHRGVPAGHGGGGGTQTRGGRGGRGAFGGIYGDGEDGSRGNGGSGGRLPGSYYYLGGGGGGGGGGYYGGGGGGVGTGTYYNSSSTGGGGGGGGSSYVEPTGKDVHMWRGWKNATDDGLVVFSWQ